MPVLGEKVDGRHRVCLRPHLTFPRAVNPDSFTGASTDGKSNPERGPIKSDTLWEQGLGISELTLGGCGLARPGPVTAEISTATWIFFNG